jgi:murein DD-endopeptidase MepM/ murein hydrolase activator NlpD
MLHTRLRAAALLVAIGLAGCTQRPDPQPSPVPSAATTALAPTPSATALPSPTATSPPVATATQPAPTPIPPATYRFGYPIGLPGRVPGDGFYIRDGFAVENTWYNPGWWHTGEDWYVLEGSTAGAQVYAVAAGEVVYAGANYPGRVVIVRHAEDLYSMYGHLNVALAVQPGDQVERGTLLGLVEPDGERAPAHLHFELRTFLTTTEVNGAAPRYGYACGPRCPPGPGYWPINAPDHPADQGWRSPAHLIGRRMFADPAALGEVVVATQPTSASVTLWSAPPDQPARTTHGTLELRAGQRYTLLGVYAGSPETRETSALAYQLWYQVQAGDGRAGWVQAAVPSAFEAGSDGRPSSIYFNFFPAVDPAGAQGS